MEIFVLIVAVLAAFIAGRLIGSSERAALLAQNERLSRDLARLTDRDARGRFVKREPVNA